MTSRAQMGTAILLFNRRNLEDKDFRLRFGFMFDGYSITRKVYWWETVVLFRKLSVRLPRRARRHNSARAWLICTRPARADCDSCCLHYRPVPTGAWA